MLLWHHGSQEKEWKDSGWVIDGVFYPVEYSNDPNGRDKILGRLLLQRDATVHPDKYHPDTLRELNVHP